MSHFLLMDGAAHSSAKRRRSWRGDSPDPHAYSLERDLPARVVVIGDLNANAHLLERILVGLRLAKRNGAWIGGKTVLVQMGDVPNRGASGRRAMDILMELRPQALEAGGDVVWLLGNHEVMSALGHEAYVTMEEYLEFATDDEVDTFHTERMRYMYELLGPPEAPARVDPIGGRMRAWEEENAPGKAAYRYAMSARGTYGAAIRRLPIAFRMGTLLFVHGGLGPSWAAHGLSGLAELARVEWERDVDFFQSLPASGIFRDPFGPLWHRAYCVSRAGTVHRDLTDVLAIMGATQMIIGHTRTDSLPEGEAGVPLTRQRGRVIMSDVGLGEPGEAGSAIVIERNRIEMWTPGGSRSVITDVKKR